MKACIFVFLLFLMGCGGGIATVQAASTPTLQEQVAQGGTINLPAGTINIDCNGQLAIKKSTSLIGAGRDLTILHDTCTSGDTVFVDLTNPANVRIEELAIIHDGGASTVHLVGGTHGFTEILHRVLRLASVELSGSANCVISDGLNQLFIEKSTLLHCSQDGALVSSFGVTFHDNWFGENGRNGVTFVDSSVVDELGEHWAGFCESCSQNNYWHNKGHGLVYNVTNISDARHVADVIDSNGDVGMVVNGVRVFMFNDGWIGSNQGGGAIVGDTKIGTVIVGNTFTSNFGANLRVNETSGPLRVSGNSSSFLRDPCDLQINGLACTSMNTQ